MVDWALKTNYLSTRMPVSLYERSVPYWLSAKHASESTRQYSFMLFALVVFGSHPSWPFDIRLSLCFGHGSDCSPSRLPSQYELALWSNHRGKRDRHEPNSVFGDKLGSSVL